MRSYLNGHLNSIARSTADTTAGPRGLGALSLMSLAAIALVAGCSTMPDTNARLEEARSAMNTAQADPQVRDGAPAELKRAADSLALANAAFAAREDAATVDHLAYLARQRVGVAQQAGERRSAEAAVARASTETNQLRLAARTAEADAAQRRAAASQQDARSSQMQAQSAQRDAQMAQRDTQAAQRDAQAAQRDAQASQMQSAEAQSMAAALAAQAGATAQRNAMLEKQMKELNAKKTERGMVVTIGDVLFDSGHAELKSGGMRSLDQLAGFLKEYPQRNVLIEGFTDSVGSETSNQALSTRRADTVRAALLARGIGGDRIGVQGHGEAYPVAGNDSSGGRQMNRRVEIVLSEDGAKVTPR